MANIKQVDIRGRLPFDCAGNEDLSPFLAQMSGPCVGVRITWGDHRMVPNEHGGQTAVYDFHVHGQEAVRWEWIDCLKEAVVAAGGAVTHDGTYDWEDAQHG